jgi:tight adherence protein B
MTIGIFIALLIAGAVLAVFKALHNSLRWTNEVQQRLASSFAAAAVQPRPRRSFALSVNRPLGRFSLSTRIEQQLTATHTKLTVTEYLMIQVGSALLGLILGWLISGLFLSGLMLAVVGWMAPSLVLRRRQAQRAKQFADQMPDMLSMLVGSLRAGYGLLHACRVIQQEMPDPMATEFDQMIKETMLGYSINDALDHLVERMGNEDLELVVTSIHIQNEVGGSLADVLETISGTIRERIRILGEIKAMTAQQRMTGWMMTLMPFGLATIMMLINPGYMMGLFQPSWILIIPIGAVLMIVIGNIVMRMVVKIEV